MKKTTTALSAALLLLSTASSAKEAEKEQSFNLQIGLGGAYTSINEFSGEGFNASATVNFPLKAEELNFYGRGTIQQTHDEKNGMKHYLEETELVLGLSFDVHQDIALFIESGDLKQSFETGNELLWQDHMEIARAGLSTTVNNFDISVNAEYRNGHESDWGYRTTISFGGIGFDYVDVGDYQSFGFSFQHRF